MAKYKYDSKHKIEREQNLAQQFTLHSAEAYSELFPTSKQGGYLTGGNYFHKKICLRCLKRFRILCCLENHKKQSNHIRQMQTTWQL